MNKLKLIIVMLLWGSIGLFTRYIEISPILLAFLRALIALPILFVFYKSQKQKYEYSTKTLMPFILSGMTIGLAWVSLFAAFKNTSISIAVLVYNMCPVYVLILAPVVLKEQLGKIQRITALVAFLGLFSIVSSAINATDFNIVGLGFGLTSGVLYAVVVLINRKTKTEFDTSTISFIQILSAAIVLLPFVILEGQIMSVFKLDIISIALIIILGIVHTGFAYYLYFSTYKKLTAITIVSYSYLEPVFSIVLSVIFLSEVLSTNQIIGGILILGSTYISEYTKNKTSDEKIEDNYEIEEAERVIK